MHRLPVVTITLPPRFLVADARSTGIVRRQHPLRPFLDRVLAVLLLLLLLPVLLAIVAAVRLSSSGPALFRQRRVGLNAERFDILKFRTMRVASTVPPFVPGDGRAPGGVEGVDRRTAVGCFLRRSCLDELPQLLNVARGEMALVGPRPERPEFVALFAGEITRYPYRHVVRPGITGLAQVRGLRGQTCIATRTRADLEYIGQRRAALDPELLARTVLVAVRAPAEPVAVPLAARTTASHRTGSSSPELPSLRRRRRACCGMGGW